MEKMAELKPGLRGEQKALVTAEMAINFLGQEDARVLATPYLVALLEMTARNSVKEVLDPGFDTVGTELCIKHLAATPMGMHVTLRSELLGVDGRRLRFRVEAFDETEKIAEGSHERFVVNIERFAARLREKRMAVDRKETDSPSGSR
jgi:fluoroacetyl-CoA thioesterase